MAKLEKKLEAYFAVKEEIDRIKEEYDAKIKPFKETVLNMEKEREEELKDLQEKLESLEKKIKELVEPIEENTIRTQHGTVKKRKSTVIEIEDEKKLIKELQDRELNHCLNTKITVDKNVLKKMDGEELEELGVRKVVKTNIKILKEV